MSVENECKVRATRVDTMYSVAGEGDIRVRSHWFENCEGVGGVQGALTVFCGEIAQAFHDDRVVELKEQLVV